MWCIVVSARIDNGIGPGSGESWYAGVIGILYNLDPRSVRDAVYTLIERGVSPEKYD